MSGGGGHEVLQGEGGEQGDPLMPGLYALGQHAALLHLYSPLRPDEGLYAFLDDVYVTSTPETLPALRSAQEALSQHANVQVHLGKTRVRNAAGEEPPGLVAALPRREADPRAGGAGGSHWQPRVRCVHLGGETKTAGPPSRAFAGRPGPPERVVFAPALRGASV